MNIRDFCRTHFKHFNAAALVDAADGYVRHVEAGGRMLVTLAGAMSTAELGISLAMNRRCWNGTGAVPNEKITWGKLGIDTPKFIVESDASIVAPLLFAYVLDS